MKKNFTQIGYNKMYLITPLVYEKLKGCLDKSDKQVLERINRPFFNPPAAENIAAPFEGPPPPQPPFFPKIPKQERQFPDPAWDPPAWDPPGNPYDFGELYGNVPQPEQFQQQQEQQEFLEPQQDFFAPQQEFQELQQEIQQELPDVQQEQLMPEDMDLAEDIQAEQNVEQRRRLLLPTEDLLRDLNEPLRRNYFYKKRKPEDKEFELSATQLKKINEKKLKRLKPAFQKKLTKKLKKKLTGHALEQNIPQTFEQQQPENQPLPETEPENESETEEQLPPSTQRRELERFDDPNFGVYKERYHRPSLKTSKKIKPFRPARATDFELKRKPAKKTPNKISLNREIVPADQRSLQPSLANVPALTFQQPSLTNVNVPAITYQQPSNQLITPPQRTVEQLRFPVTMYQQPPTFNQPSQPFTGRSRLPALTYEQPSLDQPAVIPALTYQPERNIVLPLQGPSYPALTYDNRSLQQQTPQPIVPVRSFPIQRSLNQVPAIEQVGPGALTFQQQNRLLPLTYENRSLELRRPRNLIPYQHQTLQDDDTVMPYSIEFPPDSPPETQSFKRSKDIEVVPPYRLIKNTYNLKRRKIKDLPKQANFKNPNFIGPLEAPKIVLPNIDLPLNEKKKFKCDTCGMMLTSRFNLNRHKEREAKRMNLGGEIKDWKTLSRKKEELSIPQRRQSLKKLTTFKQWEKN